MININEVNLSKSVVDTNESFIISISVSEVQATYNDLKSNKWELFVRKTWEDIKRKIF